MMDKSYIVRIYQHGKEETIGIVEDIEQNKRSRFGNAEELWKLVFESKQDQSTDNVIKIMQI